MKKTTLFVCMMLFGSMAMAQTPATLKNISWITNRGNIMRSMNGSFTLRWQDDGNLVLYKGGNNPIWASQTQGRGAAFRIQDDGNLVIYDAANSPIWASNTNNKSVSYVVLQDDGNLVLYTINNQPVWATNTGGR